MNEPSKMSMAMTDTDNSEPREGGSMGFVQNRMEPNLRISRFFYTPYVFAIDTIYNEAI